MLIYMPINDLETPSRKKIKLTRPTTTWEWEFPYIKSQSWCDWECRTVKSHFVPNSDAGLILASKGCQGRVPP